MQDYIQTYLQKADWQLKENANMEFSLQGMRNYISNEITKDYWLNQVYPDKIAKSHQSGQIHIHDLGELNSYCCGWDLQDLIRIGFTGVPGKISCAPAKHFGSILGQIVNFVYTLQGEVAGAQAFSNFDTLLAPFIRHDKLSYIEIKQELQQFIFNMNVPTRVGFQTPFFNITLDINAPSYLADQAVMIGGKPQAEKYADFQEEMNMLNQAFAEIMTEGDADGRIFTFPIPTYNIGKNFDWNDNRYEAIWKMTAKYGIPYFANYINSEMNPEDARSMCCRLRLDNRELRRRGGGLFGSNPLTGSIGVVTINLPRIGYLAKKTVKESAKENLKDHSEISIENSLENQAEIKQNIFLQLDEMMEIAKESLEIKREIIEKLTENGLYPYTKFYLSGIKQKQGKYWSNHFSTIGLVGMNELCLNTIGEDITSKTGRQLALEILEYMRERISTFQEKTGSLYNLEATPAEGTAYRLARLDLKEFGTDIIFANQESVLNKKEPYYTNSSQLPVGFTTDIFEALDFQDELQCKYTGGTVLHGFLGEKVDSIQATKELVRRIAQNYHLPYFTITPTFSVCPDCGYVTGEHKNCPTCQAKCEVYSRVVGYIRPVDQWNNGKQEEFKDRLEFVESSER